jgi:hypothetical protein
MPSQKLTAVQRARMKWKRMECLERKRKKQTKRDAVNTQGKDQSIPPSQVEAVKHTMRYMDELEYKGRGLPAGVAVTPQKRKLTADERARIKTNRLACLARKRKKQIERSAVNTQGKDQSKPACSVGLIREMCVAPSEVQAIEHTMSYMDELEYKGLGLPAGAAVTPQLRVSKIQPRTPAPCNRLQRIQSKRKKRELTADERARMKTNRLACLARKRKKQIERSAVNTQGKDQRKPACSVGLIGQLCVSPSQVEAVEHTMRYMEELESKNALRAGKVQPRTPARQLVVGVDATLLGLKRENTLRRLLLKRRDRKLKSRALLDIR